MRNLTPLYLLSFFTFSCFGQNPRAFLRYTFETAQYDTLQVSGTNPLGTFGYPHSTGYNTTGVSNMPQSLVGPTISGAQYSRKTRAAEDYSYTSFPMSTAVKLMMIEGGDTFSLCSGSMVSEKHVMTASHCLLDFGSDSVRFDSLLVCPAYDNGRMNPIFKCSGVVRALYPSNWLSDFTDITILELDKELGKLTGYLGLTSSAEEDSLKNRLYYKFSYPSIHVPVFDSVPYNGDTLYFSYGTVESIGPNTLMILGGHGIPGESGSSLFRKNRYWQAYGVVSRSVNYTHSRLLNWQYEVIYAEISSSLHSPSSPEASLILFPNPTSGSFTVHNEGSGKMERVVLSTITGRVVKVWEPDSRSLYIDNTELPGGVYVVMVESGGRVFGEKIMVR